MPSKPPAATAASAPVTSQVPPAAPAPVVAVVESAATKPRARRPAAKKVTAPAVVVTSPAPAPTAVPVSPDEAAPRAHKARLVRDSFTMPEAEYAVIDQLKRRLMTLAHPAKKSELLRAGVKALMALGDAALLEAAQGVPSIKTGRPKAKAGKKA